MYLHPAVLLHFLVHQAKSNRDVMLGQPASLTMTCCLLAGLVTPSLLLMLKTPGKQEGHQLGHQRRKRKEGCWSHCFDLGVMDAKCPEVQAPRAETF